MRNRRRIQRRGPLIIYAEDQVRTWITKLQFRKCSHKEEKCEDKSIGLCFF